MSTTVVVSGAGAHTIEYWGKDVAGNEETPHKVANFTIGAVVTLPSSLTIRTTRTSAYIGQIFILSGLARPTPDMIGRNMHVDVHKPNKAYWSYSSARTIYVGPSGTAEWWYRYTLVRGMYKGKYLFKAVYDGDGFLPCQSPIISVLVR
jgi:hypothetical protein